MLALMITACIEGQHCCWWWLPLLHPGALHVQVGMFPDVCEALALGHLSRGDQTSAMVASEWSMRNNHFPGWGRPYEFACELLQKVGAAHRLACHQ